MRNRVEARRVTCAENAASRHQIEGVLDVRPLGSYWFAPFQRAPSAHRGPVTIRTFVAKPAEAAATRKWWVVDAKGQPLGRLASKVASVLRGKHKPSYTPHVDTGDFVVVVNAAEV